MALFELVRFHTHLHGAHPRPRFRHSLNRRLCSRCIAGEVCGTQPDVELRHPGAVTRYTVKSRAEGKALQVAACPHFCWVVHPCAESCVALRETNVHKQTNRAREMRERAIRRVIEQERGGLHAFAQLSSFFINKLWRVPEADRPQDQGMRVCLCVYTDSKKTERNRYGLR